MEKNIEQRRQDVIVTAYEVFSLKGFAHTQVTTIAEASHVSTATIYKLFDSKEALFLAAYEHGLDILESYVGAGSDHEDPVEGLHVIARSYANLCDSPLARRIVRMQIAQNGDKHDPARAEGFRLRKLVSDWFMPILERCAEAGVLRRDSIDFAFLLIAGFIEHQTLTFGLIIDESKTAKFSGDRVANEAVRAALELYGGPVAAKSSARPFAVNPDKALA